MAGVIRPALTLSILHLAIPFACFPSSLEYLSIFRRADQLFGAVDNDLPFNSTRLEGIDSSLAVRISRADEFRLDAEMMRRETQHDV